LWTETVSLLRQDSEAVQQKARELYPFNRDECCVDDGRLFENCVSVRRSSEPTGRPYQMN